MPCCSGTVPVIHHLRCENGIEHKASNEAVQNELVIDFLKCSKDPTRAPEQVVEHSERAQLACSALAVYRQDLWKLRGDGQDTCAALKELHLLARYERVGYDECVDGGCDSGDKCAGGGGFLLVLEDQDANDDVLRENQRRLAIGAEGESGTDVVGECD